MVVGPGIVIPLIAIVLGIVAGILIMREYPLGQGRFAEVAAGIIIAVVVFGMVLLTSAYIALLVGK